MRRTGAGLGRAFSSPSSKGSCMRSFGSRLLFYVCTIGALAAPIVSVSAQAGPSPELPQPSPHARVEQRVGLTDVSVDYSSPAVKGRKIWGELVAYDKPWRTGAKAATQLTVSCDFSLGGKPVPAGTYALYTVPGKATWQVALNKDL